VIILKIPQHEINDYFLGVGWGGWGGVGGVGVEGLQLESFL
jgi:hypothetical protein